MKNKKYVSLPQRVDGTYVTMTDDFQYSAAAVACIVGTLLDKSQMVDWIN